MTNLVSSIHITQGTIVVMDINTNTPGAPPVASSLDCCLACMSNAKVLRSSLLLFSSCGRMTSSMLLGLLTRA